MEEGWLCIAKRIYIWLVERRDVTCCVCEEICWRRKREL